MISEEGSLSLYTDETEFKADRDHIEIPERFGFPHEVIGRQAIKQPEPELSEKIGMAVLFPQNRSMKDPCKLVLALADRFTAMGGRIEKAEVSGALRGQRIREMVLKDGRRLFADEVVICAGAFTAQSAKGLGEPIPLETERGYRTAATTVRLTGDLVTGTRPSLDLAPCRIDRF